MKVVVIGKFGQLSQCLHVTRPQNLIVDFLSSRDLDLVEIGSAQKLGKSSQAQLNPIKNAVPDLVVNCAAYTDVRAGETDSERCFAINAHAVGAIGEYCFSQKIPLIHFSTDYVFDGLQAQPYCETDAPSPLNIYGQSKLLGEKFLTELGGQNFIFRTAWLFSTFGKNFFLSMTENLQKESSVRIVDDQIGSPTYAVDVAHVVWTLLLAMAKGKQIEPGTYHLANSGRASWYELACEIKTGLEFKIGRRVAAIHAKKTEENSITRPKFSVLSCDKLRDAYGIALRPWQESLRAAFEY